MRYFLLAIICASIIITSCKEPDDIGIDLVEEQLSTSSFDTLTLKAHSELEDSLRTDETSISLLGRIDDPIFGPTTANLYTQCYLESSEPDFGNNPVADSLVLCLKVDSLYGDSSLPHTFKVYEIDEEFKYDEDYYSFSNLDYKDEKLGQKTIALSSTADSLVIGEDTVPFHHRVKLNTTAGNDLAQALLNQQGSSNLADNESFVEYFKGLYIKTSNSTAGNSLFYVNLVSKYSKLTLYYNDSLQFDFPININCARFGQFEHDYEQGNSVFKQQVISGDTTLGDSLLYLQPLAGVITNVKIPYISTLSDKNIALNKAELIVPPDKNYLGNNDPLPYRLYLLKKDEGSYNYIRIVDDAPEGTLGGYYYDSKDYYQFNITRHIQNLINNEENEFSLYIIPTGRAVYANRAIIRGPGRAGERLKLKIHYTKY